MARKVEKSDAEWKAQLTQTQYDIMRKKGTERPFTGAYWDHDEAGTYRCVGCGTPLFNSGAKFASSCGWPSFYAPKDGADIEEADDRTLGMRRTEVLCNTCGAHLGHVFNDGPPPTGLRYCINSAAITFEDVEAAERAHEGGGASSE